MSDEDAYSRILREEALITDGELRLEVARVLDRSISGDEDVMLHGKFSQFRCPLQISRASRQTVVNGMYGPQFFKNRTVPVAGVPDRDSQRIGHPESAGGSGTYRRQVLRWPLEWTFRAHGGVLRLHGMGGLGGAGRQPDRDRRPVDPLLHGFCRCRWDANDSLHFADRRLDDAHGNLRNFYRQSDRVDRSRRSRFRHATPRMSANDPTELNLDRLRAIERWGDLVPWTPGQELLLRASGGAYLRDNLRVSVARDEYRALCRRQPQGDSQRQPVSGSEVQPQHGYRRQRHPDGKRSGQSQGQ